MRRLCCYTERRTDAGVTITHSSRKTVTWAEVTLLLPGDGGGGLDGLTTLLTFTFPVLKRRCVCVCVTR